MTDCTSVPSTRAKSAPILTSVRRNGNHQRPSDKELQQFLGPIDILDLIGSDTTLKRKANTDGGEWAGPCPFCGGEDRFIVHPHHPSGKGRYWCRCCGVSGDVIDYIRTRDGLNFEEALRKLGMPGISAAPPPDPRPAAACQPQHSKPSRVFPYHNADGEHIYDVLRFDEPEKKYVPRRPNGEWGYGKGDKEVERQIYNLPAVLRAREDGQIIILGEGEKTAEALKSQGLVATTIPGGANGKWYSQYTEAFEGAHVAIPRDQDKAGHDYGLRAARELHSVAASVKIIDLPDLIYSESHGDDPEDWFEKGHTAEELLDLIDATPEWKPTYKIQLPGDKSIKLLTMQDIAKLPPKQYLADGVLERNAVIMMYAPPGEGKTFTALHLALHNAQNNSVVYFAGEGLEGYRKRVRAWSQYHDKDDGHFYLSKEPVNLMENGAAEAVITTLQRMTPSPVLLVVDTLSTATVGYDDSDNKDMRVFVANCKQIAREAEVTVLILHHSLKSNRHAFRGASALEGDTDVVLHLKREKDVVTLESDKIRDNKDFTKKYKFVEVELEDGNTSCVVGPLSGDENEEENDYGLRRHIANMLEVLYRDEFCAEGIGSTQLGKEANVPDGSLSRKCREICKLGYAEQLESGGHYYITEEGKRKHEEILAPINNND